MTETSSSIRFRCPKCSAQMRAGAGDAGQQRRCPKCEAKFRIPRAKSKGSGRQKAKKKEEKLVPVVCGVCSTRIYAKLEQVGQSIECPDCFTQNLVKPPKEKEVVTAPAMSESAAYDLAPPEPIVSYKSVSEDILEEADQVVKKEIEAAPKMPDKPFLSGIFTYPFRLDVLPIVVGLGMAWTFWAMFNGFAWSLEGFAAAVAPFLLAISAMFFVLVILPSMVTFQNIMENSANGDDETDIRPSGGLFAVADWFGDVIPLTIAASVSCVPTLGIVHLLGLGTPYQIAGAFVAYLLFPFVYLSMLENASILGVFSKSVWTSVGTIPGSWFKFWFFSTLLFPGMAFTGVVLYMNHGKPFSGALLGVHVLAVSVLLIHATVFFRLLGRMAFVMSTKIWIEQPGETETTEDFASASV